MDIIDSILLGVVQGLTEFLPVSSSGHLELGKAILGDESIPEESLLFTVVLHFATALSTIVVFRKDVWEIIKGVLKFKWNDDLKFAAKIAISMVPAAVIGFTYESELAELFGGNIKMVGFMLIITALLLYLADKAQNTDKDISFKNAFVIGFAQAIAMLPGISRSGATISTSVLLGNDKTKAARFSFLMVVPLIFGKIAKDILSGELSYDSANMSSLSIGFIAAFISGILACTWMIRLVKNSKLIYFAIYCLIVGLIAIAVASMS
ncbi:undecaprenyl-diphosphate phosphatase [Psychroserpens sp.]|uniref:undecaprenyl-diphosphate phosphatase n=1 Tax=Psychroserpens sp. TaxID=2020870 RepID=UPI001B1E2526|nr:undecaprenyl-diphosphate phosphatase [Psychroserpens sp.]MBO6605628.1 undecaprenyl-diphosphate phosphatase [Psychroserpens sp.]MBO6631169.1 undecaprenyl-diphosphate phosphatase [Psychroserpens sp.]MBO6653563.1 undecaprenyl-diphosphate phosphatase [Psychroserpens sp.]MBO6681884.1 undecaprenyl-diphosphate phosphatase [Psychroserpens sp.]MBO6749002.1 undecaprenyl-diphosphate phosphatase [Psychroserpens sp.]